MKWFQFDIIKENVIGHQYAMRVVEKFLAYEVPVKLTPVVAGDVRSLLVEFQCKPEQATGFRVQVANEVPLSPLMKEVLGKPLSS